MPADAGPSVPSQAKQEQPGAGFICTPDQLYMHVVGSYPSQEAFGYPGDHDSHGQSPIARSRADDNEDAAGASARAKKRRKTQRRAKVSEIWFPKAEMAFCTSEYLCPLSLTKKHTHTQEPGANAVWLLDFNLPPTPTNANLFPQVSLAFLPTVERKSSSLDVPSAATSSSRPSVLLRRDDYTTENKYPVTPRF